MKKSWCLLVVLLAMGWLMPLASKAQPGPGPGKGGPPPEAREACKGKSAGDQCEFKRPNGETVQGACAAPPAGGELNCRPKDAPPPGAGKGGPGPGPGKGGPPPEAIEACKGKPAGHPCDFKGPNGNQVQGSCVMPPNGGDSTCRPNDAPPPGGGKGGPGPGKGGPPPEAFEVCKGKAAGDACEFKGPNGQVQGSCVTPPNGGDMNCRPKDLPPPGGGKGGGPGKGGPPPKSSAQ